jgi:murein DD-endopeptidase MepM/ murein hydrolase activator NlpD
MEMSLVSRYYHSRKSEQYLITLVVLTLFFPSACLSEKTLIPPEKLATIDISDVKITDGFDYPVSNYQSNIITRFLQSVKGCFGCPRLYHPGVDVGGTRDTPVYAAANGVVVFADFQDVFTGYVVVIEHFSPKGINFKLPNGEETNSVWSTYLHMGEIDESNVSLNRIITRGARVGFVGDFPYESQEDYHLHFEIRKKNIWEGAAYDEDYNIIWMRPKDYVSSKFVDPSKFIRLNRPN